MKLELPEFELLMQDFVHKHSLHPLAAGLRNYSADYYFSQGNYKKVIELQKDMPLEKARTEDDIKAIYQLAYSYFVQNQTDKAKEYFDLICKGEHSYLYLANYYSGYIAYKNNQFEEALEKLNVAAEGESFKSEANLLIPTIYYQLEEYNKAFRFLKELDENGEKLSENQLLVAAEAAYAAEKYAEAAHYFSLYSKGGKKVLSRPVYYRIGYSYSMSKNAKESIPYFNKAADGNDSLCQISAYQLGVAYMDLGEKQLAVAAFDKCKKLKFDPKIQETGA
jgi:tetratricopeptide (TPR) repeat protein